jgi:hypothetical protein
MIIAEIREPAAGGSNRAAGCDDRTDGQDSNPLRTKSPLVPVGSPPRDCSG